MLFRVDMHDAMIFAAVPVLLALALAAIAAGYLPARRAAFVDPLEVNETEGLRATPWASAPEGLPPGLKPNFLHSVGRDD